MSDARLRTVVQHVFDTLVSELTSAGIDVPDRRYIHQGQVADDYAGEKCSEQFVVSFQGAFQGQIGFTGSAVPEAAIRCAMPMSVQLEVRLTRCVPGPRSDGTPPTASQLQDSAEQLLLDAWTLPVVVIDSTLDGSLTDMGVDLVGIGNVVPIGPQGNTGGSSMSLFVSIL